MSQVVPRVLLVDDDMELSRLTAARLATRGYSVTCAEGIGQALVDDAADKAHSHYPHVVVLDWRLHGIYSDYSACEALMEALPPCGKVVLSRWATLDEANRVKDRFHAQVLHKSSPADRIIEVVQQVAADQCGFGWLFENQSFAVHWPESWPRPAVLSRILGEGTRVPEDLLDSLVWQLFNSLGDGRERNVSRVSLMELDGSVHSPHPPSLGHAVVVCASPSDRLQPVILKLARAEPIEREYGNFAKLIRGNIRGEFYPTLHGHACFHDLGALEYSLVGGRLSDITSFAAWYAANSVPERIVRPLKHFFATAWRDLYTRSREYDRPLSEFGKTGSGGEPAIPDWKPRLYDLYDQSLRLSDRLSAFPNQESWLPLPFLPSHELPNPMTWVLRHREASVLPASRVAITHGDLHGGNLLVDSGHAWAIDFERAGWGHWLRDFAELEVDILTRLLALPGDTAWPQFLRLAVGLSSANELNRPVSRLLDRDPLGDSADDIRKALHVIGALRRLAREVAQPVDFREYLWALLLDSSFAAAWAPEGSQARQRALLLGGVICDRLEHWSGPWPLRARIA